MVWIFETAFQAQMPIDKATKKTVIFILQADTESIQKQQRDSFEKGNSVHNVASEPKVSVQTSTQKRFYTSIRHLYSHNTTLSKI